MADIVTPMNAELFRKQFAVTSGHSVECIAETVSLMAKVMTGVCAASDVPPEAIQDIIAGVDIELFEKHLLAILDQKDCDCKK